MDEEGDYIDDIDDGEPDMDFDDDEGGVMDDFPSEDEDIGRRKKKMSREEKEEDQFATTLLANRELVEKGLEDGEVGAGDMPDMNVNAVYTSMRGGSTTKQNQSEILRFARKSEEYQKDREMVMLGLALNETLAPKTPFPFLKSDLGLRMGTIDADEMAMLADMVRARRKVNEKLHEEATSVAIMTLAMYGVGWAVEYGAGEMLGYDLDGYASRLKVLASAEPELMVRLYGRYVRKWLDRVTGGGQGNADLMQLGMMMWDAADQTHKLNQMKAQAFGYGNGANPAMNEQKEREEAVQRKLAEEDAARSAQAQESLQPAVTAAPAPAQYEPMDPFQMQAQMEGFGNFKF